MKFALTTLIWYLLQFQKGFYLLPSNDPPSVKICNLRPARILNEFENLLGCFIGAEILSKGFVRITLASRKQRPNLLIVTI